MLVYDIYWHRSWTSWSDRAHEMYVHTIVLTRIDYKWCCWTFMPCLALDTAPEVRIDTWSEVQAVTFVPEDLITDDGTARQDNSRMSLICSRSAEDRERRDMLDASINNCPACQQDVSHLFMNIDVCPYILKLHRSCCAYPLRTRHIHQLKRVFVDDDDDLSVLQSYSSFVLSQITCTYLS